jgi:ABC-type transporter Mla MlaB component
MSELLKINKTGGKFTTLHLEGKLDGQTEKELVELATSEFNAGMRSLLLDFSGLTMITSAGLRALHTIYKMYTPAEEIQAWSAAHKDETFKSPYFKIAQPSSEIHYILSISGFLQSIYIYPSLQEASASFS